MDIDHAYDNLINLSDKVVKEGFTEENQNSLQALNQEIREVTQSTIDAKEIAGDPAEPHLVMSTHNPLNGDSVVSEEDSDRVREILDKNWNSFLNKDINDDNALKEALSNSELGSLEDSAKLIELLKKREAGENLDYYSEMPDRMKATVNEIYLSTAGAPKQCRKSRNQCAKMLLDEMLEDYKKENEQYMDLSLIIDNFNKEMEELSDNMATEFGQMLISIDEERKASIEQAIIKCKEEGNEESVKKLEAMRDTIESASNLTEFKEYCKTCKIKNFDLTKPKRVFDRFNLKYIDHKNTINDIKSCPNILDRHLPENSHTQNLMVCLAFCKYCANMSPDDIGEHTFMYFFIRNIISLDKFNPKGKMYDGMNEKTKAFYDKMVGNLKECIDNLIERNSGLNIVEE